MKRWQEGQQVWFASRSGVVQLEVTFASKDGRHVTAYGADELRREIMGTWLARLFATEAEAQRAKDARIE